MPLTEDQEQSLTLAVSNNSASATDLQKFVTAMGALNTGANDGTIDWLTSLLE